VGKTTVTVNLAGALAGEGYRVAVVDFDMQRNATRHLLDPKDMEGATLAEVLRDEVEIGACVALARCSDKIQVLRGPREEQAVQWQDMFSRVPSKKRYRFLRQAKDMVLRTIPEDVDVVLIDSPPNLGLWLQLALAASDRLLIPTHPKKEAVEGLRSIMAKQAQVKRHVNPDLEVLGIVINQLHPRKSMQGEFVRRIRKTYKDLVLDPPIYDRVAIEEGSPHHTPMEFYPGARIGPRPAQDMYRELGRSFIARLHGTNGVQPSEGVGRASAGEPEER